MTDQPNQVRTRRAILAAAAAGSASVAAQAVAPLAVRAATNGNVILGQSNTADATTVVASTTSTVTAFLGSVTDGIGVYGHSTDNTIPASSSAGSHRTGVVGVAGDEPLATNNTDETGVYGYADISAASTGVWGDSTKGTGVIGTSSDGDGVYGEGLFGLDGYGAIGVYGETGAPGGAGMHAVADNTATALYAFAGSGTVGAPPPNTAIYAAAGDPTATALQVNGKVKLSRSGRKPIGKTATSLKVVMAGVTTSSYVVATLQTSVTSCYVRAVVPASGSFTIYLSKAPGKTVYVGYIVVN